ncbi:hypothetical protein BpHYR1_009779 [Brachionus plicatilis]|uniref:Uncharacterized protein n=1 Tax=Brachionus plicatilis TaxID=10195 RepID=A0A3M7TA29_BRAPC|nr:hypothetical protein BpHYR1_009779 [Brachionus plicatilis]
MYVVRQSFFRKKKIKINKITESIRVIKIIDEGSFIVKKLHNFFLTEQVEFFNKYLMSTI